MKMISIALVTAIFLLPGAAQSGERPIDYATQVFDFGHVPIDFDFFHTYYYVNDTDHPVKILEASANCDCSTVTFTDSLFGPGDTAVFRLSFNTRDYYGPTSKAITVITDDPGNTQFKFYYTSTVGQWLNNLRPDPQSLFFLPGKKGIVVKVPNRKFDKVELTKTHQYDSTFTVEVINRTAGPGEFLELSVTPVDGLGRGNHLSTLTLELAVPDQKKPTVLSLPVRIARY